MGFMRFPGVNDLNDGGLKPQAAGIYPGDADVRRQARLRPGDGVCAVAYVPSSGGQVSRRLQRSHLHLPGSVLEHGVRPDHLSGESAGHRSMLRGSRRQGVSPRTARQLHAQQSGRCQRAMRLAPVLRVCPSVDSHRAPAVRHRALGRGTGQHRLCARLHHHRSVLDAVSVGAVSLDQGRDQAAYAAGSAWPNPQFYPYFRRQMARRQRARSPDPRSRRLLRDGSGLSGFPATLPVASERRVLRHSRQAQLEFPARCTPRQSIAARD